MPKTLLAVDDSVTMRKVLEITFSGEDFRVITADGRNAALAALNEHPQVVVIDTVLANEDGYALCKEVRLRSPAAAIVLLSSRYNAYDAGRGKDSGADDFIDKPFETQQLIDKVKKALATKDAVSVAAPTPVGTTSSPVIPAAAAARSPVAAAGPPAAPARPSPRSPTLVFGQEAPPPPSATTTTSSSSKTVPVAAPSPSGSAAAASGSSAVATAVNGHLAGKLGDLGLSAQQADAVLALSREVVERVVWEVVPQLAETLIKEEIARLTRE
ncbi:MAG TPA: response regulator [Polyangiaceae bacterium]|nr:response regulator [Polyangiaceae bacterium]